MANCDPPQQAPSEAMDEAHHLHLIEIASAAGCGMVAVGFSRVPTRINSVDNATTAEKAEICAANIAWKSAAQALENWRKRAP